jgi:hypothetical protein
MWEMFRRRLENEDVVIVLMGEMWEVSRYKWLKRQSLKSNAHLGGSV